MFEGLRQFVCNWQFIEVLHFWIEVGQTVTLGLLFVLVIKMWKHYNGKKKHD